ncbi:MAG TPA: hypothetical protein VJ142_01440 [Candidatus Nanoarchaeia archaeon]|nr:hypothetical protein [Candidatus Nanoarchaeia archaeon]
MLIKQNNKKGGEKVISVYWFIILFLVAGAIVYMVGSFYGKPYDVRQIEADLLASKASKCVSYAGYLNEEILEPQFLENFPESCAITFKGAEERYSLKLNLTNLSSGERLFETEKGNINLKFSCGLKGENLPFCLERSFYVIDKNNNQYRADILSIVGRA